MQFTIASIIVLAASASAVLVSRDLTCAEGSKVSCCTTTSGDSGVLGNVAGGSCLLDQVSLLSALDNQCPSGNTFCCPTNQDGTLNIQASCLPINA